MMSSVGGNMDAAGQAEIRSVIDDFGNAVSSQLQALGLRPHSSPFFRPFSLVALRDRAQILIGCSPGTGMSELKWVDEPNQFFAPAAMVDLLKNQLGWEISAVLSLPLPNDPLRTQKIAIAAAAHVKEVETLNALGKLGDIQHVRHLENDLRRFLEDHPEPSRNVFIMMRFSDTPQMQ